MKELTIEQKAERYDEAITKLRSLHDNYNTVSTLIDVKEELENILPELKDSEDEKIKQRIIKLIKMSSEVGSFVLDKWEADEMLTWLEKQGENSKSLYIRFGDIPKDEKSKIYSGETEIGTERGVSVYPAFENLAGNIVLGLSLPITKTSLYTQQHLLEYDNRACYLVSGDYVGKGTDGEPLLRNVKIVREIKDFRVKQSDQNNTDKDESKFHEGDWIIHQGTDNIYQVVARIDNQYQLKYGDNYTVQKCVDVDRCARLWDITKDAKDGDILYQDLMCGKTFIYNGINTDMAILYSFIINNDGTDVLSYHIGKPNTGIGNIEENKNIIHPATKEQCDILFQKMKEAGYEWDAEKKKLHKVKGNLTEFKSNMIQWKGDNLKEVINFTGVYKEGFEKWFHNSWEEYEKYVHEHNDIFKLFNEDGSHYEVPIGAWIVKTPDGYNVASKALFKNKPTKWNNEDEKMCLKAIKYIQQSYYSEEVVVDWLKSLKYRVQPNQEWSEEDKTMKIHTLEIIKKYWNSIPDTDYDENEISESCYNWLKSFRLQKQ